MRKTLLAACLIALAILACGSFSPAGTVPPATATIAAPTETPVPATDTPAPTLTPEPSATPTATPTDTPTPTATLPPSPTPTFAILRGSALQYSACRYGPGPIYLWFYGLPETAVQEIIGRTDTGKWVLTRAPGGTNVCWIKASLLDIKGDVMAVEMVYPDKYTLPVSPYYRPPTNLSAVRKGNIVTIDWEAEDLRAGDEADSPLFVVEVWACQGGQVTFTPIGANQRIVEVTDEPGCSQPSHGRVYLAEKHGYAGPSTIPWPTAAP